MTGADARRLACVAAILLLPWGALPAAGADPESDEARHSAPATDPEGHAGQPAEEGDHGSRLSDELVPLRLEGFPRRPRFLLELGNPYLGTGRIHPGIELPTGAIWQPSLILFGTFRTALQTFERGDTRISEWTNRLDLFANLQLSGSERLVVGFRNLDRDGRFTSYILEPDPGDPGFPLPSDDRFHDELNAEIQSLFFEGDFGEIFPRLDFEDTGRLDVGFSVGRQPLSFQEGMLIDDSIDGLGITRNSLQPARTSNLRTTLFFGIGDVDRANREDRSAELVGLLTSTDLRRTTVDADLVYVAGDEASGDLLALGVSAAQRLGSFNTSLRVLGSWALDRETPFSTNGALLFAEVSRTPHHTHDLLYFTAFWALDEFSSAARGPATGGPLGRAGVNFAASGLGSFGAPLSSRAREVAGGAIGYQKFFGALKRRQLLAELGARLGTDSSEADAAAVTLRYQVAVGRRIVLVIDGFGGYQEALGAAGDDTPVGGRLELVLKF